jgi:uncharacterized FAD-dependent dehydrogenase
MSHIVEIFLPIDAHDEDIAVLAARALALPKADVGSARVLRRSLDARKGHPLGHRLRIEVLRKGESAGPISTRAPLPAWPASIPRPRVVIVGSGPAGTWAALRLAEAGVPSTILERGKPVQPRRHDLASVQRGRLNDESNYCFGEGGAGTFSDGKLYTRTKDREAVDRIIGDLIRFGAPKEIEIESRPHVGSNRLPKVLTAVRAHLENAGVQYRFSTRLTAIVVERGRLHAIRTSEGDELPVDCLVLATGHSARDVFQIAWTSGAAMERKASAVGVRLEHPQPVIDRLQYGRAAGHPRLPAAFYHVSAVGDGRGVYSFCMCPGGFVVPAATEVDGIVVNGMSLSRRDSPFANAAMVVSVNPEDYGDSARGPLAGIEFQRRIEQGAFSIGGGSLRAPAQRLTDFLARRPSSNLPKVSYHPGALCADLDRVFPSFITSALRAGLQDMTHRLRGFLHEDAVMIAAETRTSSPVRIVRDERTLESPSLAGLYPAGEGAGYAGGIVSAAIDGERVARAILARSGETVG